MPITKYTWRHLREGERKKEGEREKELERNN